jgi:SAM-dependent methyltransferase
MSQVEYGPLAGLYDLINEEYIDYDAQARFVVGLLRELGVREGWVLDLGCATAQHALRLARAGYGVVGVDCSLPLLRKAKRRLARRPDSHVVCADLRTLPLRPGFAAAVCLNHTINYMLGDDLARAAREVRRVLRPGGVWLVDFFHYGPADKWNAVWREIVATDDIRVRTVHRMTVDPGEQSATDAHVYLVTRDGRTQSFEGVDRLRITTLAGMEAELQRLGFQVVRSGTKADLGMDETDKSVLIAARVGA